MAAVSKLTDVRGFEDRVVRDAGLPYRASLVVAAVLPWLELTCGLCLALGWAVREAATILTSLLAGLVIYAVVNRGQADCRCFFFPTREPQWTWWTPARNAVLLACAAYVAFSPRADKSTK